MDRKCIFCKKPAVFELNICMFCAINRPKNHKSGRPSSIARYQQVLREDDRLNKLYLEKFILSDYKTYEFVSNVFKD